MMAAHHLPSGGRGRILAVALGVLVLACGWVGGVAPLIEWHAQRAASIEGKQMLLARMEMVASQLPAQRAQAATPDRGARAGSLLRGGSDSIAAAELQGLLQETAGRSGLRVTSLESLAPEPRSGYRRVAVRVAAEGRYPGVLDLLGNIAAAAPGVLVDGLTLRGPGGTARSDDPPVTVSFTVIGLRDGEAPAKPGEAARP